MQYFQGESSPGVLKWLGFSSPPGLPDRSICGMYLSLTRLPTGVRRSVDWHRHPQHFRGPSLAAPCFASMMAGPWFLSVQRSGSATRNKRREENLGAPRGSLARATGYHLTDRHQAPPARVLGATRQALVGGSRAGAGRARGEKIHGAVVNNFLARRWDSLFPCLLRVRTNAPFSKLSSSLNC